MLRHELNLIGLIRLTAFAAAVTFACLASYSGVDTGNFVERAQRTIGTVADLDGNGSAVVSFRLQNGSVVRRRVDAGDAPLGGTMPLLYVAHDDILVVKLDRARDLWAPMWHWIAWSVGAFLIVVYGRALVDEPLSVIGFKGARLWEKK